MGCEGGYIQWQTLVLGVLTFFALLQRGGLVLNFCHSVTNSVNNVLHQLSQKCQLPVSQPKYVSHH